MASSDVYTVATQLAVLSAGRAPVWEILGSLEAALAPPADAASGVPLQGAVRALIYVALREDARHRTARLTIASVDLTATYTLTVNGVAVGHDATGAADLEEVLEDLADAINGDADLSAIITAEAIDTDDDDEVDTILLTGVGVGDFSIDFVDDGGATCSCVADYATATLRPWYAMGARVGVTPPQPWVSSGDAYELDWRGRVERLDTAGLDRLHLQLEDLAGAPGDGEGVTYADPTIAIGPCLAEL